MKRIFTDKELQSILSDYAQGVSLMQIGKKHSCYPSSIRYLLKKLKVFKNTKTNVIFYKKKCKICGKYFWTDNNKRVYCYNPCSHSYTPKMKDKVLRHFFIKYLKADFYKLIRDNPQKAIELSEQIEKEEGKEFKDLVLGNFTEKPQFKKMMDTYNKYKKVFEVDTNEQTT